MHRRMRNGLALTSIITAAFALGAVAPASASPTGTASARFGWDPIDAGYYPGAPSPITVEERVTDLVQQREAVGFEDPITYCVALTAGQACSISTSVTKSSSITVAAGFDIKAVKTQISRSWSESKSVSVSCTSGPLAAGQRYYAYPTGTKSTFMNQRFADGSPTSAKHRGSAWEVDGGVACAALDPVQGKAAAAAIAASTVETVALYAWVPDWTQNASWVRVKGLFDCSHSYAVQSGGGPIRAAECRANGLVASINVFEHETDLAVTVDGTAVTRGDSQTSTTINSAADIWSF